MKIIRKEYNKGLEREVILLDFLCPYKSTNMYCGNWCLACKIDDNNDSFYDNLVFSYK